MIYYSTTQKNGYSDILLTVRYNHLVLKKNRLIE